MRIKKKLFKGVQIKSKDYALTKCKKCTSKLFSMEYLYNNGLCNQCVKHGKPE